MDELLKDLFNKPFEVGDTVYVHSGSFRRKLARIVDSDTSLTSVIINGVKLVVVTKDIVHYTRGQEIYPDQFTPCEEKPQKEEI